MIKFSQQESEPQVVESMPFDKYELQDCSLSKYILSLKRTNVCWFCFVESSHSTPGTGRPFGYVGKPFLPRICCDVARWLALSPLERGAEQTVSGLPVQLPTSLVFLLTCALLMTSSHSKVLEARVLRECGELDRHAV